MKLKKEEAFSEFITHVLGSIPYGDKPALRYAWSAFTDGLCKEGRITDHQFRTWTHPRVTQRAWGKAIHAYELEKHHSVS